MSKIFIDTNILVYTLDKHDRKKHVRCRQLLKQLEADMDGVMSTQVMQEFYVTAVKKLGVEPLLVKDILRTFESNLEVVLLTPALIKEAIDCQILSRISFWDALIVIAAESANCDVIWSEDLNHGQIIRGVRIENPLHVTKS